MFFTSLEVGESCHGVVIGFKRDPALSVADNFTRQPRDMITQGGNGEDHTSLMMSYLQSDDTVIATIDTVFFSLAVVDFSFPYQLSHGEWC